VPSSTTDLRKKAQLREHAEFRIKKGTAPHSRGGALSADALAVLYRLASDPGDSGEGLKLLHELQTHQVELDLQHEQLEANECEFAQGLAYYKALYEDAPVGYFIVGFDGHIIESNLATAQLLGVERDEPSGCPLASFLLPESRSVLAGLLKKLHDGAAHVSGTVQSYSSESGSGSRCLQIAANRSADGDTVQMVVSGYEPGA